MQCQKVLVGNQGFIVCSSRRKSISKCFYCGQSAELLCDYPLEKQLRRSGTCDKKICSNCSDRVLEEKDYCKAHTIRIVGKITIGNYKLGDKGIYIGRAMPTYGLAKSPLGNPWKLGSLLSPEKILAEYRKWLWEQMNLKGEAYLELQRIVKIVLSGRDVKLICWCKDAQGQGKCHGDIVKKALEWMIAEIQNNNLDGNTK